VFAWTDFKTWKPDCIQPGRFETLDETVWRWFSGEAEQELFQSHAVAFDFDKNALY